MAIASKNLIVTSLRRYPKTLDGSLKQIDSSIQILRKIFICFLSAWVDMCEWILVWQTMISYELPTARSCGIPWKNTQPLIVQSQQWKHQKNVNNIDTRTTLLVSLLLILNRFHTLLWCFNCWLWTCKYWLEMKSDLVGMFSHLLNVDETFCDLKICLQGNQSLTMKGMQSKSLLWKSNRESHLYCMFSRK